MAGVRPEMGGPRTLSSMPMAAVVAANVPGDQPSLAARTRNRLLGSTAAIGAAFALSLSWSAPVGANPSGGKVVGGSATIQHSGAATTVTSVTDRAIINWQSFSVGAGEAAKFVQPNGASAVLNRVTGADPSSILGQIQSNGKVFLINPNGVLVGQGAHIETGDFV
ncbi:MAG TPA: filamentous hemagglutinin N-terminal domain-containing protein, partial [Alphaproteobacteria bacterium]|nr:filamentous hemagglutinin N-terminal domain-containing protein [Alphaproteobacteria bacterium]